MSPFLCPKYHWCQSYMLNTQWWYLWLTALKCSYLCYATYQGRLVQLFIATVRQGSEGVSYYKMTPNNIKIITLDWECTVGQQYYIGLSSLAGNENWYLLSLYEWNDYFQWCILFASPLYSHRLPYTKPILDEIINII